MKNVIFGVVIAALVILGLAWLYAYEGTRHSDVGDGTIVPGFLIFYFGVILQLILAFICGNMASNKGRSGFSWGFLEFLFGPIVLIIVAAMTPVTRDQEGDE